MNKIILLVGDSGSGKDFVLETANEYEEIEAVKRYISRGARENEENTSISSIFNTSIEEIQKLDYYYEGVENGNWYGIDKKSIDKVLMRGKNPMVICPNYGNFLQMLKDYNGNVVPFFIYRGSTSKSLEEWKKSLLDRGSSLNEINKRENKRDKYFKELYVEHFIEYGSNVILNLYGVTTKEDIMIQIEGLCNKNNIDISRTNSRKM